MDKEFTTDKNRIAAAITPQTVQAKRIGPTLTPDRSRGNIRGHGEYQGTQYLFIVSSGDQEYLCSDRDLSSFQLWQ